MKVSIVTPCLNSERFIGSCVDSISDERPDEYIVVDGGSTDRTLRIVEESGVEVTHLISERDNGLYDALNKGLALANGEVLGYLNADDFYLPGTIKAVREIFSQLPQVDWITTQYPIGARSDGTLINAKKSQFFVGRWHHAGLYLPPISLGNQHFIPQESTFWRRRLWQEYGVFPDGMRLAGDFDFWNHCFANANLYYVGRPFGVFRCHEKQLSRMEFSEYLAECRIKPVTSPEVWVARGLNWLNQFRVKGRRIKFVNEEGAWRIR